MTNYWFSTATDKQKKDTEMWKNDLKNYLSISKEGVPVNSLNELLDNDGVGQIPFVKLGFKHLNDFLYECSEFLVVGKYNYGQLFLFAHQAEVSPEVAHIAKLVKGQERAKGTNKNPRPLRHQIAVVPTTEILKYSTKNDCSRDYRPPPKNPRRRGGRERGYLISSRIQSTSHKSFNRPRRLPLNDSSDDNMNEEMDRWDFGGGNKPNSKYDDEDEWELTGKGPFVNRTVTNIPKSESRSTVKSSLEASASGVKTANQVYYAIPVRSRERHSFQAPSHQPSANNTSNFFHKPAIANNSNDGKIYFPNRPNVSNVNNDGKIYFPNRPNVSNANNDGKIYFPNRPNVPNANNDDKIYFPNRPNVPNANNDGKIYFPNRPNVSNANNDGKIYFPKPAVSSASNDGKIYFPNTPTILNATNDDKPSFPSKSSDLNNKGKGNVDIRKTQISNGAQGKEREIIQPSLIPSQNQILQHFNSAIQTSQLPPVDTKPIVTPTAVKPVVTPSNVTPVVTCRSVISIVTPSGVQPVVSSFISKHVLTPSLNIRLPTITYGKSYSYSMNSNNPLKSSSLTNQQASTYTPNDETGSIKTVNSTTNTNNSNRNVQFSCHPTVVSVPREIKSPVKTYKHARDQPIERILRDPYPMDATEQSNSSKIDAKRTFLPEQHFKTGLTRPPPQSKPIVKIPRYNENMVKPGTSNKEPISSRVNKILFNDSDSDNDPVSKKNPPVEHSDIPSFFHGKSYLTPVESSSLAKEQSHLSKDVVQVPEKSSTLLQNVLTRNTETSGQELNLVRIQSQSRSLLEVETLLNGSPEETATLPLGYTKGENAVVDVESSSVQTFESEKDIVTHNILKSQTEDQVDSVVTAQLETLSVTSPKKELSKSLPPVTEKYIEGSMILCKISEQPITASTLCQFIVSDHNKANDLRAIEMEMKTFYEENDEFSVQGPLKLGCYAAYIPEWKKWARCYLRRLPMAGIDRFVVMLYDYCIHKVVSQEQIRYLTCEFYKLPQQSYMAKISEDCSVTAEQLTRAVGQVVMFILKDVEEKSVDMKILTLKLANERQWESLCERT